MMTLTELLGLTMNPIIKEIKRFILKWQRDSRFRHIDVIDRQMNNDRLVKIQLQNEIMMISRELRNL